MNLHKKVLSKNAFSILKSIQSNNSFDNFYLSGGTSLSLQIGHRISVDLDFFSQNEFAANIVNKLKLSYKTISLHDNSVELSIDEVKVFFFYFAYPLYKKTKSYHNLRFAHPVDIGLQKLLAFQGRNQKKDIVDLYFINKFIIPLQKLLKIFEKHFPASSFNSYDSLKSIVNMEELENQPDPKMIEKVKFEECKRVVIKNIKAYFKEKVHNLDS